MINCLLFYLVYLMLLIIFYVHIILKETLVLCNSRTLRGDDISRFGFLPPIRFRVISWILPAFDVAYHHVSWLFLQQVRNVL